jgi:hypothetical protein
MVTLWVFLKAQTQFTWGFHINIFNCLNQSSSFGISLRSSVTHNSLSFQYECSSCRNVIIDMKVWNCDGQFDYVFASFNEKEKWQKLSGSKRFRRPIGLMRKSQWPLRHELPSLAGSNPTQGMDVCIVCIYCVCVVLCVGSGLATGWSSVQLVLPTVNRIKKLKSGQGPTTGCRAIIIYMMTQYV